MKLCVIPARGGSKRIPRKNIKNFCGKPIIAYSIQAALNSNLFDNIIVSTDDLEIAKIAESYGANIPFLRPAKLANDHAGTIPVVNHAIEWFIKKNNPPNEICCLYATAPFIKPKSIITGFELMNDNKKEFCFTATSFAAPIQRAIKINKSGNVSMFFSENINKRSQDFECAYHDAGQFYWGTIDAWLKEKKIFSEISTDMILPRHYAHDIDTPEDWQIAELMFKTLQTMI